MGEWSTPAGEPPAPDRLEVREYGTSQADLERLLPRLVTGISPVRRDRAFVFTLAPERTVTIVPGPEQYRRLGGLRIPYMELRFEFAGVAQLECENFLARFGRVFHKGGG